MIDKLIAYEQDDLVDPREVVSLFSELVKTGQAWVLQGHYGRTAMDLIEGGYLHEDGEPNWEEVEDAIDERY